MGSIPIFDLLVILVPFAFLFASFGMRACSEMEARSEPPEVGVVQDVDKVPASGVLGGQGDIYLEIDGKIYRYHCNDPVPVAGTTVEYRADGDRIIDINALGQRP